MPRSDTAAIDARAGTISLVAGMLLCASLSASASPSPAGGGSPGLTPFQAQEAPHPDTLAKRVAFRYGAPAFHGVKSLHYVFRVRFAGKDMERGWTWFPREDSVIYRGKDSAGVPITAAYSRRNRFSLESPAIRHIDQWFINDQYWLLFPLHLVWDKGLRLRSSPAPKPQASPAGKPHNSRPGHAAAGSGAGEMWMLTAVYPSEGGYTPGDAYDLFVDSAGVVTRWIFRKGDSPGPTREAMWSPPVPIGPLQISLERTGPKDGFKLWFEDVKVQID